jgi:hypothetical protein
VLQYLRCGHTPYYFSALMRLFPAPVEPPTLDIDSLSDAAVERLVARSRELLCRADHPREALIELEAVLVGETAASDEL